jgi:RimJ/RimL family protein N-acetyltransferase
MELSLSQSTIRSFRPTDAASVAQHIGTASVARNTNAIPYPYSIEQAEWWIAFCLSRSPQTNFAIALDDEVIGGIGVDIGDPRHPAITRHIGELGYWLGETYWGRGIMTEAVAAFTEWAFTHLELTRLQAAVYARNPASARVLTKAGFEFEGRQRARYCKHGEVLDALAFARVRLPASTA